MKSKLLTTVSTLDHPGLRKLEHSLKLFGYDYHIIQSESVNWGWGGWDLHYQYAKKLLAETDYTHLIYTDGFDTLALAPQSECDEAFKRICGDDLNKFVYSTEKQYFPHEEPQGEVTPRYRELFSNENLNLTNKHRWRFANGGQYMGSLQRIIEWYENAPKELNNQYWANKYFVTQNDGRLKLDFNCELFQSVAFSGEAHGSADEFSNEGVAHSAPGENNISWVEHRLKNNYTGSMAPLAHGNGRADFQFVYDILGL